MNRHPSKSSVMTLLLITAFILSAWLASNYLSGNHEHPHNNSNSPDSFMDNVEFILFDKTGDWQTRFSTPRLDHFSQQDESIITRPHLISRGENQLTWNITADTGISHQGGKVIDLQHNVLIKRITPDKVTDLTTTALTAYPKQKFASTPQPVHIVQPGSTVNSIGLTADLKTGDINLLSAIQGEYAQDAS